MVKKLLVSLLLALALFAYSVSGQAGYSTPAIVTGAAQFLQALGINTSNRLTELHVASTSTDASNLRGILNTQHSTGTDGARLIFYKSRGTEAEPSTVVTGDLIGNFQAYGYDGSSYLAASRIRFGTEGTIATDRVPGYISFATNTGAAPSSLTERMRINSTGVGIGTTAPVAPLHVVQGVSTSLGLLVDRFAGAATLRFRRANGSFGSESAVLSGNVLGAIQYQGYGASAYSTVRSAVEFIATENWTDSAQGTAIIFYTVPTGGSTTQTEVARLTSVGLGIGTTSPSAALSFGGEVARTIGQERRSTADAQGNTLTIVGGGTTIGATDKVGGDVILASGISTGTGTSKILFQVAIAGSSGTSDNTPTTVLQILNRHLETLGTAPTLSSCGGSPSVTGTDMAGKVTIGSGATTSCTVTFAKAYTNAPSCTVTGNTPANQYGNTTSTSALTITSNSDMNGNVVMYNCLGMA